MVTASQPTLTIEVHGHETKTRVGYGALGSSTSPLSVDRVHLRWTGGTGKRDENAIPRKPTRA